MPIIPASAEAEVGDTVQPKVQDQQGGTLQHNETQLIKNNTMHNLKQNLS
jgi:hypothetical protein